MTVQVLVSTMNRRFFGDLIKSMNIKKFVIINQITKDMRQPNDENSEKGVIKSFKEKGLSKSRNRAIASADSSICVIADDDMYYVQDYENIIINAYDKYPGADIIAFYVDSHDKRHRKNKMREGRLNLLDTMKLASWNITFKKNSIELANIHFDEKFGSGTEKFFGEDNIFLFDCIKNNIKIYYIPVKIATLLPDTGSSWFTGHTNENYIVGGAVYYRMFPLLSPLMILQFVIRKNRLYHENINAFNVARNMFIGAYREMRNES